MPKVTRYRKYTLIVCRIATMLLVALLVVVGSSCDKRIGLGLALRESGGAVTILVPLCQEQDMIHNVFVNLATTNDGRERIWDLESRGEHIKEITLGVVLRGFTEKVRLPAEIPFDRHLAFFVGVKSRPPYSGVASAKLEQLEPGKVFYTGRSITRDEYHKAIGC